MPRPVSFPALMRLAERTAVSPTAEEICLVIAYHVPTGSGPLIRAGLFGILRVKVEDAWVDWEFVSPDAAEQFAQAVEAYFQRIDPSYTVSRRTVTQMQ